MSDVERSRLARLASTGDLDAAVELVVLLMRGKTFDWLGSTLYGVRWPHPGHFEPLPARASDLAGRPVLTASELDADGPQSFDLMLRWLVTHNGQVVTVSHDPAGLRCEPPSVYAAKLEESNNRLCEWAERLTKQVASLEAEREALFAEERRARRFGDPAR